MPACNICGGERFVPGPNDRLSESGAPPRCADCYSLERHRSLRACLDRLPRTMLSWRRAIQFAPDPSLDPSWFRSYEGSQYDGENSLDLQAIDRPAGSYDFISLSSVLEFIPDDRRAFSELARIASANCLIHCTFTPAASDVETHHYGEPHGTFGRYHLYGSDLSQWLDVSEHGLITLRVTAVDPATGTEEPIHFFCRKQGDAELLSTLMGTGAPTLAASE